jgi:hypothetical protein
MTSLIQSNFKVGDNVIKKYGISVVGKIINKNKSKNSIIFPGIGNTILDYEDNDIEICDKNSSPTYNNMIKEEYFYWSNIKKDLIDKYEMTLKEDFSSSNYVLKRPCLINGLLEHNNMHIEFSQYDEPKYLDHHIDSNKIVWIKLFFSDKRVAGWIQSYKVKFKFRIMYDLFCNPIKY